MTVCLSVCFYTLSASSYSDMYQLAQFSSLVQLHNAAIYNLPARAILTASSLCERVTISKVINKNLLAPTCRCSERVWGTSNTVCRADRKGKPTIATRTSHWWYMLIPMFYCIKWHELSLVQMVLFALFFEQNKLPLLCRLPLVLHSTRTTFLHVCLMLAQCKLSFA